jgi:hypothetical protein
VIGGMLIGLKLKVNEEFYYSGNKRIQAYITIFYHGCELDGEVDVLCLLLLVDAALDSVFRFFLDARDGSLADLDPLYSKKVMQPSFSSQSGRITA